MAMGGFGLIARSKGVLQSVVACYTWTSSMRPVARPDLTSRPCRRRRRKRRHRPPGRRSRTACDGTTVHVKTAEPSPVTAVRRERGNHGVRAPSYVGRMLYLRLLGLLLLTEGLPLLLAVPQAAAVTRPPGRPVAVPPATVKTCSGLRQATRSTCLPIGCRRPARRYHLAPPAPARK